MGNRAVADSVWREMVAGTESVRQMSRSNGSRKISRGMGRCVVIPKQKAGLANSNPGRRTRQGSVCDSHQETF